MVSQLVRYGINAAIIAFVWQVLVHPDGPDLPVMTIFWEGLFLANLALAVTFRGAYLRLIRDNIRHLLA
ncbi:unnamed protein product [Fusarium fujikuroi]|nr:unnamed protein product [Fusarium fujikuroi]